jgi:hypothetical protein
MSLRNLTRPLVFAVAAAALTACDASRSEASIATPASATAVGAADPAVVQAVRSYLHTLKLNENDLVSGLAIPFGYPHTPSTPGVGLATVTGRKGPAGHVIYKVTFGECSGCEPTFTEIAPE